ncbi:SpoIIIAH-like family protein [Peribacillus cavernae]|uniref:SpoIIIAH-like family protein n=1 Tax=Peribacillus cavernae TaxID=1674310 RepID=A0A3S0VE57_9BACI|nr:SpoIIIAH-like family protein [Peribacillus cavernae]MDQ0220805.1 stage III sporulation protein AH [Peribacillus cavernae]RUQ24769.1 SpoIIIAH-like family protein [Peribacillus cavernae]
MLLKKQTVWLLTMLSLVVVLSVYYLTTPEKKPTNMAATEQKEDKQQTEQVKEEMAEKPSAKKSGASVVTKESSDAAFESMRLEIDDNRSKQKEELTLVMANTDLSAEERSEAKKTIEELDAIGEKEQIIESLIGAMNYDAALVRVNGQDINITVKADKQSASAANDIIQLVSDEFEGMQNVAVDFQPKK